MGDYREKIEQWLSQLTLEEKAGLCSGLNFWQTKAVERLGIPSLMMTDGPHGLRKQQGSSDHLGLYDSVPATCFPTAAGLAATWNRDLLGQVGEALGRECRKEGVSVLLGPGNNIKRSPLCGRNFEYFSEDPYLAGEMAAAIIQGVQSQGVGTSLKHYAVNNQEHRRMSVDAVVDERTLREIYLTGFEIAVKKAQPWSVMCSYNKINGTYGSEHEQLLTNILREEWGFAGFVVSDWGAVNERVDGLAAGLDLEMPSSRGANDRKIVEAVKSGRLSEEVLDRAVRRMLEFVLKALENRGKEVVCDLDEHHRLARRAARETMVLLKNEGGPLPLSKSGTIAVLGQFAVEPRFQGGGSSHVNPHKVDIPLDEIRSLAHGSADVLYAQGYRLETDDVDESLLLEAAETARKADVAVLFVGLPERYESEGFDRTRMAIPESHRLLIERVADVQPNTVVVLMNGSPVEMPWIGRAKAVLEAYLGGQAVGGAVADLLFGVESPSGKLAETFPVKLSDNPSYLFFPGEGDRVEYREGLFVGYRYYDTKGVEPLFPFGHGLSYTRFEYDNLAVDKPRLRDDETVEVRLTVRNIGEFAGKETVQLYVRDVAASVVRPDKELKAFAKVELAPGEAKTVTFTLDKRAFAYWHAGLHDWYAESGEFELLVGSSSRDIRLRTTVEVESSVRPPRPAVHRNTLIGDLLADPRTAGKVREIAERTGFAAMFEDNSEMMRAMMGYMPLRAACLFSGGNYTEEMMEADIKALNELD
jgi:beta-glucosidase